MKADSQDLENTNSYQKKRIFQVVYPFIKALLPSSTIKPEELIYTSLKGGNSQANLYHFELDGSEYVLRLLPPHASSMTRRHQINLAIEAGNHKFGPKVYFVDLQMQGMIIEFIFGQTSQPQDFVEPDHLIKFAKFLQQLHKNLAPFPIACSPYQRFNDFISKGEEKNIIYPSRFAEIKILINEIQETFQRLPTPLVPSHLDLHPLNIMFTGKCFCLVDWVNGGLSDPFFDLATFSIFHDLNEWQMTTFLSSYFNRPPTQQEWDRFIVAQPIRLFVIAVALLTAFSDKPSQLADENGLPSLKMETTTESMENHGLTMYNEGLKLIDHYRFKKALEGLKKSHLT